MSDHSTSHHAHPNYFKIWITLLILLVISVLGPMVEIQVITLITAFGIAGVKAYIVASRFMHLDTEKKFVTYLLLVCVALMVFFFFAIAPDIMNHSGTNWRLI